MHREVKNLADTLKDKYGDQVIVTPDDQLAGLAEQAQIAIVMMDCGNLDQAESAAQAANEVVERNPNIKLLFGVNGCENDPRELDQIPAARDTLKMLMSWLKYGTFMRFDPEHRALMLVAIGVGHREGTQLHVPSFLVSP